MEMYLSVGVTTIVALMAAHRVGRGPMTLEAFDLEETDRVNLDVHIGKLTTPLSHSRTPAQDLSHPLSAE
jgi:hypothetical protein